MTKLHLGCGQKYLKGYTNIDFPLSEHSVQEKSVADEHQDITALKYAKESINEVRLHHVFEHFMRPIACGLLASWNSWLTIGGTLRIEVPDYTKSILATLNPFKSRKQKNVAIRHLFGSHEATWAVHAEGYSTKLLSLMIEQYGFIVKEVKKNSWQGTYNIEVIATKTESMTFEKLQAKTQEYLETFLLHKEHERDLLAIWMNLYQEQTNKSFTK